MKTYNVEVVLYRDGRQDAVAAVELTLRELKQAARVFVESAIEYAIEHEQDYVRTSYHGRKVSYQVINIDNSGNDD